MHPKLIFHHMGAAVNSIDDSLKILREFFQAEELSDVVFDPLQEVNLVLVKVGGLVIELVSGKTVSRFVSDKKGLNFYHACYETKEFDKTIDEYSKASGVILVSPVKPAVLFNRRRVAFFMVGGIGFVEILEGV